MIFECSIFQNTVEDMILFRCFSDDEILGFYRLVREMLEGKDYRIVYLKTNNVRDNLDIIRKERTDDQGNELWFPLMMHYFNDSPYAIMHGVEGEDALMDHFKHRQALELRICQEVFPEKSTILLPKGYTDEDLAGL